MEREPYIEPMPHIVESKPELELAWRGLVISMELGGLPRAEAVRMLEAWGKQESTNINKPDTEK